MRPMGDKTTMLRTLSIRASALVKFALPPLWIGGAGYVIWLLWVHPERVLADAELGPATLVPQRLFLALWVVSLVPLFAFVVPLKRVRLGPDGLCVSNYVREITIPFSAIESVRQSWLPTFRLITLELRTHTPLGRRVIFMPAGPRPLAFWRAAYWRADEIVRELRSLAAPA